MMGARPLRLLAVLLLAGCVQPPVLSLADRTCDAAPRLAPGNDVRLGSSQTVTLDALAPCVETPAGRASYAVFTLPPATSPYRISVRSSQLGTALISPEAVIYGADDHPRLAIGRFRGAAGSLLAATTGEPGDRYLVVTSTPAAIGRHQDLPTAAYQPPIRVAATIFIPIIIPAAPVGPVTDTISTTLAHSGRITVSAAPFVIIP